MDAGDRRRVLAGIAAAVVGAIQVAFTVAAVVSPTDHLTVVHTLQLVVCGSLLVTGVLTLITVWRGHRRPDQP